MKPHLKKTTALVSALVVLIALLLPCFVLPAVAEDVTYAFNKTSAEGTAVGEGGALTVVVGGEYRTFTNGNKNTDGDRFSGTIVFQSDFPITNYNFTTLVSKVGWGGDVTFSASKDGTTWETLTVTTVSTGDYGGNSWKGTYNNNYGTLAAADGYYYLRAELNANGDDLPLPRFPSIAGLQYNSEANMPESYAAKVPAKNGTPDSGETETVLYTQTLTGGDAGGYTAFNLVENGSSTGNSAAGALTFKSAGALSDVHVHMVKSTIGLAHTIEVSKDGTAWETPTMLEKPGAVYANSSWAGQFTDYYFTLDEADGYLYVRVTLPENPYKIEMPAMGYVEYNFKMTIPESYEVKVMAADGTAIGEGESGLLTKELSGGQAGGYACFKTEENGSLTDTGAAGKIHFYSEYPITDLHIHMLQNTLADRGATFEISTDGVTWTPTTFHEVPGAAYGNNSWKSYYTDYYGAYSVEQNIHAVRVSLPSNPWALETPALGYVEYTREGEVEEVPINYDVKRAATKYQTISDATLFKRADPGIPSYNDERPYRFSNGAVTTGWVTYYATANATHFRANTYLSATTPAAKATLSFAVSNDLENWTPVEVDTEAIGVKWPTCLYTYGSTETFRYVKVMFDGSLSSYDPGIYSMEFFTDGNYDPNADGGATIEPDNTPVEGAVPEMESAIADLKIKSKKTVFSNKSTDGMFKANNMGITPNGKKNSPYFGTTHAMAAQSAEDTWFIMYTPRVRDFKFTMACTLPGNKLVIKAYGRTAQYSKEVEIPLVRTADIRPESKGAGTPWYEFRVADRDAMAKNYQYIRIEIVNAVWTQCLNFTYFYTGADPGPVPEDERPHVLDTVGTERKGVQSICAEQNNLKAEFLEHMAITGNGGNAGYIGCKRGVLVYPDDKKDGTAIFKAEGIDKFWVKFCIGNADLAKRFKADIYVSPTLDAPAEEWVKVPTYLQTCPDSRKPTGFKIIELVSADNFEFPVGCNYIKIVVPARANGYVGTGAQIARIDYTYTIPEGEKLPAFATPDTANNEQELMEDFSGSQLLAADGGLAEEAEGVEWMMQNLGTHVGSDKVYYKVDFVDAYFVYNAPGITSIDVRGYRHESAEEDMLIYVSADGEEWIELTEFERRQVTLYSGLIQYSHLVDTVPAGMNYVKIMYPEFAGELTDITVSDIQILYDENVAPVAAPIAPWIWIVVAAAAVAVIGGAVAVVLVLRKRRITNG